MVVYWFGYGLFVVFSWVFKCVVGKLLGVVCVDGDVFVEV